MSSAFPLTPPQRAHGRSKLNDNLDEKGTLEYLGKSNIPGKKAPIVSQKPRYHPRLTNGPPTFQQTTKKDSLMEAATIATATARPVGSNGFQAVTANGASKESPGLRLDGSSSLRDDEQDSTSMSPTELDRIMAESKVWAHVAPLVPQTWTASITNGPETSAFIQAISLPLRNKMDIE